MANYKQLNATTQVKVGAGKLYGIAVSATSSGTLTIYDTKNSNTSDPKIFNTITLVAGTTYLSFPAGLYFNNGLYIVLANTAEFTVAYD